jgi:hypothetical protein
MPFILFENGQVMQFLAVLTAMSCTRAAWK